jgi:hypothetical protein
MAPENILFMVSGIFIYGAEREFFLDEQCYLGNFRKQPSVLGKIHRFLGKFWGKTCYFGEIGGKIT